MSLEHLIVKPATESQHRQATLRNAAHWGVRVGISVDDFVKLYEVLHKGSFARDGRFKTWVLAPEDDPDTTDFYASCQVLTREVLTLGPGQTIPTSSFGHVFTTVLVPPEYRGKGYAQRFMSLMHSALAPHRYPNPAKAPVVADHASTVSALYSAVGNYYARCVPSEGESGWTLQKSFITTWPLSSIQVPRGAFPPVELLSESGVAATLDSDDCHIPADLLELQKKDPTKTYFAFAPTAPLNEYSVIIGRLAPGGSANPSWGAKIPGGSDFMTWTFFGQPNLQLIVTRLRATVDSFPVLLHAAFQAAQDAKCASIEIWNVPEHLKEIAQATGGETTERDDNLSGFKWYGQESETKVENTDVVWALDERYSWC